MAELRLLTDIGGTNARFALTGPDGRPTALRVLKTADYPSIVAAARAYLGERRVRSAVLVVAGPADAEVIRLTNCPWVFSVAATKAELGLDELLVINDFVAQALAIPELRPDERRQIGEGAALPLRPIAVLGAGTGLGVAGLLPLGDRWLPVASEGGHISFAPHDEVEIALLQWLQRQFGHVSNERLLAGPGLVNLANGLAALDDRSLEPLQPAEVVAHARAGSCPYCVQAVQRFAAMLGGAAGDLAMMFNARGGVYLAGGVLPHLGALFDDAAFRRRFLAKGRFESYLATIATFRVTRPDTGLLGAAMAR